MGEVLEVAQEYSWFRPWLGEDPICNLLAGEFIPEALSGQMGEYPSLEELSEVVLSYFGAESDGEKVSRHVSMISKLEEVSRQLWVNSNLEEVSGVLLCMISDLGGVCWLFGDECSEEEASRTFVWRRFNGFCMGEAI
ncbi:hypothetical protein DFH06DRAFT_1133241 [Mycena polygramma]|nr:hypothetical protein DFH06DRAFT_1133241 [Mycena polygramma]